MRQQRRCPWLALWIATRGVGCVTSDVDWSNTIEVRHELPARMSAAARVAIVQTQTILDETPGGAMLFPRVVRRGLVANGTLHTFETADIDGDGKLEGRVTTVPNPFTTAPSWSILLSGQATLGQFMLRGKVFRTNFGAVELVAEAVATKTEDGEPIEFGARMKVVALAYRCVLAAACGGEETEGADAGATGAGSEVVVAETGAEAVVDTASAMDTDAGADAGAGADVGTDADADAGTDADADAGAGVGTAAGIDAGTDAGTDASAGVGAESGTGADADVSVDAGEGTESPDAGPLLSAGGPFTCARKPDGLLYCWGADSYGQLGLGHTGTDVWTPSAPVVDDIGTGAFAGASSLATGEAHACAIVLDAGVYCWGSNAVGQLGIGTAGGTYSKPAAVVGLTSGVASLGVGAEFSCALLESGGVACWGNGAFGSLGNGSISPQPSPIRVSDEFGLGELKGATGVSAGAWHACAVMADRTARCWGMNSYGQCGDGTTTQRSRPVAVKAGGKGSGGAPFSGIAAIAAGNAHTCALLEDGGAVMCWGYGQFNSLDAGIRLAPVQVAGLPPATAITAGFSGSCAIVGGGGVYCWGSDGLSRMGGHPPSPVVFDGGAPLTNAVAVSSGRWHTCAMVASGGVYCWGNNSSGQLGTGDTAPRFDPAPVVDFP